MEVCLCYPSSAPCLGTAAVSVKAITDALRVIWEDMANAMDAMPCVGLEIPQIGAILWLEVVDGSQTSGLFIYLPNLEMVQKATELYEDKGASPNLPGIFTELNWLKYVSESLINEKGMTDRLDFTIRRTNSVQHQVDYLNRKKFFDNLFQLCGRILLKRARKAK